MAAQSKVRMTTFKHLADKGKLGIVDRIIDNAVLREIFEVGEDADLKKELETYVELYLTLGDDIMAFAGPFIFHHAARS
jgi:hypothetical protein